MSQQDLHPTDGARFLFELDEADEAGARYRAAIYTPTDRHDYTASLTREGGFEVQCIGEHPAATDLEKKLTTMARLIARDASRRAADGLPAWPRRVLRWRGPK